MSAYYNEFDPYAAQWLRNLIAAGHIADGVVDERSITDVKPDDLRDFTQCHFFAGIGVWSHALRLANWNDDRAVWTGSCPCQPFSVAGKGEGSNDERHLWPVWFDLIRAVQPPVIFGEQVAAAVGHSWLDTVQADLEAQGYSTGASVLGAHSVGAPHIRQRLYFVADALHAGRPERRSGTRQGSLAGLRPVGLMGDDDYAGLEGQRSGHQAACGRDGAVRPVAEAGESSGVADTQSVGRGFRYPAHIGQTNAQSDLSTNAGNLQFVGQQQFAVCRPGPTNGHWRDADWLFCRDGKWRPVEPGTFPLVDGASSRVGRLRAYGNAIVAPLAQVFIEEYMKCRP